jgi:hypothetical protein
MESVEGASVEGFRTYSPLRNKLAKGAAEGGYSKPLIDSRRPEVRISIMTPSFLVRYKWRIREEQN